MSRVVTSAQLNKAGIIIESEQVDKMLSALTSRDRKKAEAGALMSSAVLLKNATVKEYKSKTNLHGYRYKVKNKKGEEIEKKRPLAKAVWDKFDKNAAKVHIMSDFRVKFFEMGTVGRFTKGHRVTGTARRRLTGRIYKTRVGKGGYRGRMTATWIFRGVKQRMERPILSNMTNQLYISIMRISRKYGSN